VGNIGYGLRLPADGAHVMECPFEQAALSEIRRSRYEARSMRGIRRGTDWRLESVADLLECQWAVSFVRALSPFRADGAIASKLPMLFRLALAHKIVTRTLYGS
jgi:hypothetical protein